MKGVSDMKIAFIGTGNMGGALIEGVCRAVDPTEVIIFDIDRAKRENLSRKTGCSTFLKCIILRTVKNRPDIPAAESVSP